MTGFNPPPLRMWSYEEAPSEWKREPGQTMMETAATRMGLQVTQVQTVLGITMPECALSRFYIQWAGQQPNKGLGLCMEDPSSWLQGRDQTLAQWGNYMVKEGRPLPTWVRMWAAK